MLLLLLVMLYFCSNYECCSWNKFSLGRPILFILQYFVAVFFISSYTTSNIKLHKSILWQKKTFDIFWIMVIWKLCSLNLSIFMIMTWSLRRFIYFSHPNTLHAFMLYIIKCVSDTCHCVRWGCLDTYINLYMVYLHKK